MAVVLGIDPGSRICGYGLVETAGNNPAYLASGIIRVGGLPFDERLKQIHAGLAEVIEKYHPREAAIEEVFVGRNAASALKLGQARGVAIIACTGHDLPVYEYASRKVKQAVTGSGRASKSQMQHMIASLLSLSSRPQEDAADALCIAVCHVHTQTSLIKMAGVGGSRRGRLVKKP